ncbi:MAG: hypothetical protein AB1529_04705 [Candidatus Micrarchaeota archaeon]
MELRRGKDRFCHEGSVASRRPAARILAAAVIAASLSFSACGRGYYAREPESVIYNENNRTELSAEQLGFARGATMPEEAAQMMRSRGLTHVVENTNVSGASGSVGALIADYQAVLHIFRNRRYEQSIRLDMTPGELPYGYALRVADTGDGRKVIMALIRDAAGTGNARMALVPYAEGRAGEPVYVDMGAMVRRHEGMQFPLFVGYDLVQGVTFIARDRNGIPWENGYLLTWDGTGLRSSPVPFDTLMGCDCVRGWAEGRQ